MPDPLPPLVTLFGTSGNDLLMGADDARDWIAGNDGDDTIYGLAADDKLYGNRGHDTLTGGLGNDQLSGGAGNDKLYGDDGDDRISGDQGDDLLNGGAGRDKFTFIHRFGRDTITDFSPADDTIQFSKKSFADFAAVQAVWSQDGADVLITFGAHVLLIKNVLLGSLTSEDFLFV